MISRCLPHSAHPFRAALLFAVLLLSLAVAPVCAQDRDPVVAKVNSVEVRLSDLAIAEEEAGQIPPMSADAKRDYLITLMTDMLLVAKAAEVKKMGDSADFKRRLAFARNKLLMEVLLQSAGKEAQTDEAMRKVYAEATKPMTEEQEVQARHILVATEEEAKMILADLKKGGDFAAIAKEKSKDPGSKDNGGDLGYFGKDQMVPEFANTAFALDKGALSDPVKTQFGWHIIKVEDKRAKPVPTFDQVKPQIEGFVARKAQADLITKLRETAKVERLDKPEIKPAEPAKK